MDRENNAEWQLYHLKIDSNKDMDNRKRNIFRSQEKELSLIVYGNRYDSTVKQSIKEKIIKDQLNSVLSMELSTTHKVKDQPKYFDIEETYLKRCIGKHHYSKEKGDDEKGEKEITSDNWKEDQDEKGEKEMTSDNWKEDQDEKGEKEITSDNWKEDEGEKGEKEITSNIVEYSEKYSSEEMKETEKVDFNVISSDDDMSFLTEEVDDDESNFVQKEELEGLEKDESRDSGHHSTDSLDSHYVSNETNDGKSRLFSTDEIHCDTSFFKDLGLYTLGEMSSLEMDFETFASERLSFRLGSFCHVYNVLSSLENPPCMGRYEYLNNIFCPSLSKDVNTISYNDYEEKRLHVADNMMNNNVLDKELNKKSPMSMDNRDISTPDTKQEKHLGCESNGQSAPGDLQKQSGKSKNHLVIDHCQSSTLKSSKLRQRSGSDGKQGHHRSKKHNKRGRRNSSRRNSGGSDHCDDNSVDSAGSGGDGNGDEDGEKDRKRRGGPDRTHVENDEEEDEKNSSDDDNKTEEDEITGAVSNLLLDISDEHEKSLDKDLTNLLSDDRLPPPAKPENESISGWQLDTDTFSSVSDAPRQDLSQELESHSHMPMDTLCDIIGAASSKDYLPNDQSFLPMNLCMTSLTHNLSQAPILDCHHCLILSELLKHVAECDSNAICHPCTQGYNLIWHHTRLCIQNGRQRTPYSRTDLCFKLCQNVRWDIGWLSTNTTDNRMTIKKVCNRILALPCEKAGEPTTKPDELGPGPSSDCEPNQSGMSQNGFRRGGHTTLTRKPSNTRRSFPPPISEQEEDEKEEEKGTDDSKEDSVVDFLRQEYGQKREDTCDYVEMDYISSMPQGHINDQLQFNSFVNQPKGVKGVGEAVYSSIHQLRLVAGFWEQKKDDIKRSGKRPFQRAEEGVILERYKRFFKILGTRYQLDFQWHKLTSLGSGMTGSCYLAMDKTTSFRFCVKKIDLVDYKKEELSLWSDLDHPNVVTFYGALRHSDTIYLFTEYIDGGDLLHCIEEHKSGGERLSHWLALKYFQQLLQLLVYLESKNLMHEDIKADNILLRANSFHIVLTDFGLCHRLQKPVELKNKAPAGTATHFSPEKAASLGHGIPACVWACVCVLVHMLSGQQPWHKYLKKVDYLNFTIFMKPPPLDDVPDNIRAIVKDLIAQGFTKDPEQRPTARQLLEHEAFNILNLETETYLSNLVSGHGQHASGVNTSRNVKDKGFENNEEQEVSLYNISLPHHSNGETQRSFDVQGIQNCAPEISNAVAPQEMKMYLVDEPPEGGELKGAGGGESKIEETFEKQVRPIDLVMLQNRQNDAEKCQHRTGIQKSPIEEKVQEMINPTLPDLETLLASSEEPIRSYLTDTSSVQIEHTQEQLEVYNPVNIAASDQLPLLSIFDNPFSWEKDIAPSPTQVAKCKVDDEHYFSSGDLDSAELLATGIESDALSPVTTSFIQKKPPNLTLDVSATQHRPIRSSLEKSSQSRRSTNSMTSSSVASSVFFTGSANKMEEDVIQELKAANAPKMASSFVLKNVEEKIEDSDDMNDVDKKKSRSALQSWKTDNEDALEDGHKLTLLNEDGEELFRFGILHKDFKKHYKHHVSEFKAQIFKLGISHFEITNMDGVMINYDSPPSDMLLKVKPIEDKKACFCAGCQF